MSAAMDGIRCPSYSLDMTTLIGDKHRIGFEFALDPESSGTWQEIRLTLHLDGRAMPHDNDFAYAEDVSGELLFDHAYPDARLIDGIAMLDRRALAAEIFDTVSNRGGVCEINIDGRSYAPGDFRIELIVPLFACLFEGMTNEYLCVIDEDGSYLELTFPRGHVSALRRAAGERIRSMNA